MTDEAQTFYLTKYALSEGIVEVQARAIDGRGTVFTIAGRYGYFHHGRDIFLGRVAAILTAEAMRLKRIASLKKSLAKLEATEFN